MQMSVLDSVTELDVIRFERSNIRCARHTRQPMYVYKTRKNTYMICPRCDPHVYSLMKCKLKNIKPKRG